MICTGTPVSDPACQVASPKISPGAAMASPAAARLAGLACNQEQHGTRLDPRCHVRCQGDANCNPGRGHDCGGTFARAGVQAGELLLEDLANPGWRRELEKLAPALAGSHGVTAGQGCHAAIPEGLRIEGIPLQDIVEDGRRFTLQGVAVLEDRGFHQGQAQCVIATIACGDSLAECLLRLGEALVSHVGIPEPDPCVGIARLIGSPLPQFDHLRRVGRRRPCGGHCRCVAPGVVARPLVKRGDGNGNGHGSDQRSQRGTPVAQPAQRDGNEQDRDGGHQRRNGEKRHHVPDPVVAGGFSSASWSAGRLARRRTTMARVTAPASSSIPGASQSSAVAAPKRGL